MPFPRAVLLVPAATCLLAGAVAFGSCTATTAPTFPSGAAPVPATFATLSVAALPSRCAGQAYFEASTSLCSAGFTYFLCDGSSYTEYACEAPGSGWAIETLSKDPVGSGQGACAAPATATDGALPVAGTVYVEANAAAPGANAILVFRYCSGGLSPALEAQYPTGGTGSADLDDTGVLDADQQLTLNGDRTLLFAVNQGSDTVSVFQVGAGGLLTAVAGSPFPSGGVAPASVGVSGDILIVANKASDGVRDLSGASPNYATFSIAADGTLTPTGTTFPLAAGSSPIQAYVAPGGKLVFTTEESGVIRGFQLSPTGSLALAPGSPLPLPNSLFAGGFRPQPVWPAGLSASPVAPVLYTGVPNNDSIAVFDFTPSGALSLVGGYADPYAVLPCWSIVSADGSRLYFANAGSDNISVWDTATDPRKPTLVQSYLLPGGGNPWGLRLDPTGQLLFVIAPRQIHQVPQGQGQLLHALRIAADGTLDEVYGSPVPLPVAAETNPFGLAIAADR